MRKRTIFAQGKDMTPEEFGSVVEIARRQRRWSQQKLGEKIAEAEGVEMQPQSCRVTVSRIELGTWRPTPNRVAVIKEILNISDEQVVVMKQTPADYKDTMSELLGLIVDMNPSQLKTVVAFAKQIKEIS